MFVYVSRICERKYEYETQHAREDDAREKNVVKPVQ